MFAAVGSSRKDAGVRDIALERRSCRCRQGPSRSWSPTVDSASSRLRTERSISFTVPGLTRASTSIRWRGASGSASRSSRARKAPGRTGSGSRKQEFSLRPARFGDRPFFMSSRGMSTGAASRTFDLEPLGDYSLRESAGFIDAWHEAPSEGDHVEGHLHLAFLSDGAWVPAGVCLTQDVAGRVTGTVYGTAPVESV